MNIFLLYFLISLPAAFAVYIILLSIGRGLMNSAVAMYFTVLAFFSYGSLYDLFDNTSIHGLFSSQILWISVYFLLCIFVVSRILRTKNASMVQILSGYLSLLVAVLFIINAGLLCLKFAGIAGEKNMPDAGLSSCINPVPDTGPISSDRSKPDIYYIVLDEYASSDTIEKYYGYSNQGFENFLRDNGFYVSGTSVSSYVSTDLALAAVLNMEKISPDTKSKEVYRLISEDRVSAFLKNIGYKYIHIGSSMEVNKIMPVSADYYYNYFTAKRFYTDDDLSSKLVDMSILRPLFYTADWTKVQQESVYFSFDKILEVSGIKGPKYVFAHVVCPHHPFVFDMDGNPLRISDRKNWEDKSIYLGQYIYVTKLVESLIGRLLKGYRPDGGGPVVIIQSDHGPRKVPGAPDEVKYGIFNAMLLPGIENGFDIESIPQEETFKRIFGPFVKWK